METQSHRFIFFRDSSFSLEIEFYEESVLLHCEVQVWTKSVLRKMYLVFAELERQCMLNNISKMMTVTPNPNFAKLFGGETVNRFQLGEKEYEVIIWELKHLP